MTPEFLTVPVLVMAIWQALYIAKHGSIFADLRARCEATLANSKSAAARFFAELFLCPLCLSMWLSVAFTAPWVLVVLEYSGLRSCVASVVLSFACAGMAYLGLIIFENTPLRGKADDQE